MIDFKEEMSAAMAGTGDEPQGTPDAAPETPQPEQHEPVEAAGDEPQGTPVGEPAAEPSSWLDEFRQQHGAELVDQIYQRTDAELKRGLTPKLQKLSELEKQYEGIEAADAEFLRQVYQAQQTSPQLAREMLLRAADHLYQPPETQAEEEPEFATEVERQLWVRNQRAEQELQEIKAWRQQEQQARARAEMDAKFSRLETEVGRPIPYEEKQEIAAWCVQNGKRDGAGNLIWAPDVDWAWKVLNFEKVRQQARSEAAGVVERKAAISPGPSSLNRGQPPPREPETIEEAVRLAFGGGGQ